MGIDSGRPALPMVGAHAEWPWQWHAGLSAGELGDDHRWERRSSGDILDAATRDPPMLPRFSPRSATSDSAMPRMWVWEG
jgi:hypothetical protein